MSGYVAGLVWKAKIPGATLTEKGVLALYGDVAHDDGTHIYRSKASIAERAQASKDTIKRVTRWLLKSGLLIEIRRSEGGRYRNTTEYAIDLGLLKALAGDLGDGQFERAWALVTKNLEKQEDSEGVHTAPPVTIDSDKEDTGGAHSTRVKSAPGAHSTPEGVHTAPPGGAPMHPPRENVQETSKDTSNARASFAELWAAYPHSNVTSRRGSKAVAFKAFEKRVRTGVDPTAIVGAARLYAASDDVKRVGPDGRDFVPGLVPWLNGAKYEPWLPEPIPDAKWREALAYHQRNPTWWAEAGHRKFGPPPGQPGCRVPEHLLAEVVA